MPNRVHCTPPRLHACELSYCFYGVSPARDKSSTGFTSVLLKNTIGHEVTMKIYRSIIFFIICLFVAVPSVSYAERKVGSILKVKKEVFRVRKTNRVPAVPRMPLGLKDAVETGKHSRVKMSFGDNSVIILGELSTLKVQTYLFNTMKKRSNSVYRLINGSLKVIVGRSDLKIHTLSALVAARGTEFMVWIGTEMGKTYTGVIMIEGKTTVESSIEGVEGKVTVLEGQMTRVFLNEPPEAPRPTDVKIMNELSIPLDEVQPPPPTPAKSSVSGEVVNKSSVKDTSNVAIGNGSQANTGSVVME
jgi:hypothetical protein